MTEFKKQRIALLVDAENLEIQTSKLHGSRFDYQKLLQEVQPREMIRALYFKPENKMSEGLEQKLLQLGYEVKLSPKNSDTWLAISGVTLAEKCDVIRLVAADSDYLPLLWYLQSKGVRTEVCFWQRSVSRELKALADEFIPLTRNFLLNPPNNLITLAQRR